MTYRDNDGYGVTRFAQNAREALVETAYAVIDTGSVVRPRGMETTELRHYTVVVRDPTDWHSSGINALWAPKVAACEAVQLAGGFIDPDFAIGLVERLAGFTNEDGNFDGAYGPRVRAALPEAVRRLQVDPGTRQAIVPIYGDKHAELKTSKDYPCTLSLHFLIRDNALDLDVSMRSNDVNWGFKHDMSQFMILQCSVANILGIDVGRYVHTADSMHIYSNAYDWVDGLSDDLDRWEEVSEVIPRGGIQVSDVRGLFLKCENIAYETEGPSHYEEDEVSSWLRRTIHT